jgi:hypothetical protein
VQLEGLGQLKKSTSSGTRTGDLKIMNFACSFVWPVSLKLIRVSQNRALRGTFGSQRE